MDVRDGQHTPVDTMKLDKRVPTSPISRLSTGMKRADELLYTSSCSGCTVAL